MDEQIAERYDLSAEQVLEVNAIARRHGVDLADLDFIPDPRRPILWVSYGPEDDEVEPLHL